MGRKHPGINQAGKMGRQKVKPGLDFWALLCTWIQGGKRRFAESKSQVPRAKIRTLNFFFFLLKAKGATEGFLSREVTRVHMNFRLICQAEVGKQQKRASVGRSGRLWWNKGGGGGSELRQ